MYKLYLTSFIRRVVSRISPQNPLTSTRNMAAGVGNGHQGGATKYRNRLSQEKSPYLLQHASNPVDWYPWGAEAFEKAKKENKIIFLSVGYSTCHWCHVMERESFENEAIGEILNQNFVSIKVDREERPDVDKVYMAFIHATAGGGGWPMSVWLTPDLKPIVGGTYFPPDDRYYGRPGFKALLQNIATKWRENREGIEEQSTVILDALIQHETSSETGGELPSDTSSKCYRMLERGYDKDKGGFGNAPKFPQPVNFRFLHRIYNNSPSSGLGKQALNMSINTLKMMSKGGIYDHMAEGFHRYSTDNDWHVPHFEKMLYDQAQLAVAYAEAYQITKDESFATVVRNILTYVDRDLSDKSGGFYSAEDADSLPTYDALEKKEGAFCVWTEQEILEALSDPVVEKESVTHGNIFCYHYDVKTGGNVDPYKDPHDELKNKNVLIVRKDIQSTADEFGLTLETVTTSLKQSKEKLFEIRKKRPKPHLDNKMITSWNGLMISGFAKAGQILGDSDYIVRGQRAAEFIQSHLYNPETGVLLRSCYVGEEDMVTQISVPIEGFADDYAYLIHGLMDLYEANFDVQLLEWAELLQNKMDELFWDQETGGYYTCSDKDNSIVLRLKEDQDGAEPSANSVAATNLLRLSSFLDRPELRDQCKHLLTSFGERIKSIPLALPHMVTAHMQLHQPPSQVIVVGDKSQADTQALINCVHSHFTPNNILILGDERTDGFLYKQLPMLKTLSIKDDKATAYVCENFTCSLPVNYVGELEKLLSLTSFSS